MTGGNTRNLVLKRMLRYFLKISSLKKISQFQDRICFLLKTQKNNRSSESDFLGNTKSSFKENARNFSKNSITQGNVKTERRLQNLYKKENFKSQLNQ